MDSSALLAQKLSVLDFMRGDLARMNKLIPASERIAWPRIRSPFKVWKRACDSRTAAPR